MPLKTEGGLQPTRQPLREVEIAKTALKAACVINVAKLKVHYMALVTLFLKNLLVFILPKGIMHENINEKLRN